MNGRRPEPMKIGFYGAAHEVTGSCTLITVAGRKGIVDFGMEQGKDMTCACIWNKDSGRVLSYRTYSQ